ncbi:MAG: alpha/beta fold hydrolase, partial [Acidimicrobiia bacterium]
MDEPFHRTLDSAVGGGNLSIGMSGPDIGTAPVALAVHGITGSHRSFRAIARHLGQDLTVLAPDLRGRGASSQLPTPEGLDTHVADLVRVLDGAGVERAVLVGHSMGAYIVARLAAAHPQRASAVVLIDGGIPLPVPEGVDLDDLLAAVLGPAFARLRMEWDSLDAYRQFWRAHPAFARAGAWNDDIGDYVDYDLAGTTPPLRSRVSEAAVKADGRGVLDAAATRRALG